MRIKMIDFKKELNIQQYKAVIKTKGNFLVMSSAGSGKTRTIVYRLAYLIKKGVNPSDILLLTFTKRAAEEMVGRAGKLLNSKVKISGGTFHGFALKIISHKHKNFSILDQEDSSFLLNSIVTKPPISIRELQSIFCKRDNNLLSLPVTLSTHFPDYIKYSKKIMEIDEIYKKTKLEQNLFDYDDLIISAVKVLKHGQGLHYKYIMVDEYQDTSKLEVKFLKSISKNKNLMVVGDPGQGIYGFRGASISNIINFDNQFFPTTTLKIEQNYRSSKKILRVGNAILNKMIMNTPKLISDKKGNKPIYHIFKDGTTQALFIIEEIKKLRQNVELKEMVVLFRTGYISKELEIMLALHKIPFVKYGGIKFLDFKHIRDYLSLLKIKVNKKDRVS